MDTVEDLPAVFRQNNLFLLPVSRKQYAIVNGRGYHALETISDRPTIHLTQYPFPTIARDVQSEMIFLDYCQSSGLLERATDSSRLILAFRGRRTTPKFSFDVNTNRISVDGAQIEVDGGFENPQQIIVIEAKIGIPSSFSIRQLYYPFRTFRGKKTVRNFFMCFNPINEFYLFWEYEFSPFDRFESIRMLRATSFRVKVSKAVSIRDYQRISFTKKTPPQADSVDKIMEFPFRVSEGSDTSEKMARAFGFDVRQSSYYRHAAEELGLVAEEGNTYRLTEQGEAFLRLPAEKRANFMCKLLLQYPVMNEIFMQVSTDREKAVSRDEILDLLRQRYKITGSTLPRRAQTITAWFKWIRNNLGIVEVDSAANIRVSRKLAA